MFPSSLETNTQDFIDLQYAILLHFLIRYHMVCSVMKNLLKRRCKEQTE